MQISLAYLIAHCICSILFAVLAAVWRIKRPWAFLFTAFFFMSQSAVFLIWGPLRYYGLYAVTFVVFLFLAKGTQQFYNFLKTQEALIRYLFGAAIIVFGGAVMLTSISEISLRRDVLTFWSYESKVHPTAQALNNLGDVFFASKDFMKAQEYYQKAIRMDPRSIKANLGMGEIYRIWGQKDKAVETFSHLLSLFPDDEGIDIKVIEAYGRAIADNPQDDLYKEQREEVLADFEQLSKRKNYNAADYFNLGFLYEQVGGKEEAMRYYAKALQKQPNNAQALYNLANLNQDAGNYKTALGLYGRLIHYHPQYVLGYLNMGIIFNALGDQQRARQFYLKVIELDPNNGDAYFNLGYLSESQGELSDAVNYYEKAVEVAPKNAENYYNLGNVYASLGQNGEAIASYLKTIGLNPRHQDAFVNLSILSFKARDFQGAIHYLEQAKALGYNPPAEYLKTLEPYRRGGFQTRP